MLYVYWLLDLVVHAVFAFKYWDLAHKVDAVYKQQSSLNSNSNLYFSLLLSYCALAILPYCYEMSNYNNIKDN